MSVKSEIKKLIQDTIKKVTSTGQPESIVLYENENWAIQLLVVPPRETQYGAVTVKRDKPAVLLSIRSAKLWRNNLTIPSMEAYKSLMELLNAFDKDSEVKDAVADVLTPRVITTPVKRLPFRK